MPCESSIFQKYLNHYFVETGSYMGDGISNAINAGFQEIISIELSDRYYHLCKNKFQKHSNIRIYHGDSHEVLPDIIYDINMPITFWLDGHYSCGDTALGKYWAPLMQELDIIKKHKINTHTIMIDDMRCWKDPNPNHGFVHKDIIDKLHSINSNYTLTYEYGFQEDDILVAHL